MGRADHDAGESRSDGAAVSAQQRVLDALAYHYEKVADLHRMAAEDVKTPTFRRYVHDFHARRAEQRIAWLRRQGESNA